MSSRAHVLTDDLERAAASQGAPIRLTTALSCWPVELQYLLRPGEHFEVSLRGRKIIVIGTTLYDDAIEVPKAELYGAVVVIRKNAIGPLRYGYGIRTYSKLREETWECSQQNEPADTSWDLIMSLRSDWKCTGEISFLGLSAGNLKTWCVYLAASRQQEHHAIGYQGWNRCGYVV